MQKTVRGFGRGHLLVARPSVNAGCIRPELLSCFACKGAARRDATTAVVNRPERQRGPSLRDARSAPEAPVGDTQLMPEKSTTPDVVELVQRSVDAVNRRDFDQFAGFFGTDSVWDLSPMGLGVYEGSPSILAFVEDWNGSYEEFELVLEEVLDLGNEVVFAVVLQSARLTDSTAQVRMRYASVNSQAGGVFERITNYTDIDQARAAGERLAQERG
jgi:ketosteroid isomerase-like protein